MPNPTQEPIDPALNPQPTNRKKVLIGVIFSLILIIIGSIAAIYLTETSPPQGGVAGRGLLDAPASPTPTATPFPFEEMTIPFLRAKVYDGLLNEQTKISESGSFTSFLTSYLSDKLEINGLLTIPSGTPPKGGWPAIVFVHGYIPPNQYQTTERYTDYVNFLARNNFVVFKIDLRGHGQSEGEPGGGYYSSDYVIDTLNAYHALEQDPRIDQTKIGLWGHSMAGNVVLRALAAKPKIPAAVIWGGAGFTYTDLLEYRISDGSYQPQPSDSQRQRKRAQLRELYGDPDPNNWFWKQVIPTNYLADFKTAIQLNHAVDDRTVNIEYSRNLNLILNQTSLIHELHEYPSGDHNISGSSFTPAMQNTVNFFKEHLK
jgi:dipeptidyl aminopeptidase/acylaminoacyl peptidase